MNSSLVLSAIEELLLRFSKCFFRAKSLAQNRENEISAAAIAPSLQSLHAKILSDNAYMHAGLLPYGIQLVPVWSPAVGFLFTSNESADVLRARLLRQNIGGLLYSPQSMNTIYLMKFPFFAQFKDGKGCEQAGKGNVSLCLFK